MLISKGNLLVSDEYINGGFYTKLPGGGLELGESTRDCLKREFLEEAGLEVEVGEHLYTTDYCQMSAFGDDQQVLSIYYWVHCDEALLADLKTHEQPFDFGGAEQREPGINRESYRWVSFLELTPELMSLPIDQELIRRLLFSRPRGLAAGAAYFLQKAPFLVPTTDGKRIEEHFGAASTGRGDISIARMEAPPHWSEPAQWPEFDEWTLVSQGRKSVEVNGEAVILEAGQSIWVSKGARVRYSNPFDEPCIYWSVCLPAFTPALVHREA